MNVIKSGVAAAIASLCLAVQADNCTWTNFVANTPDTAYSWNNPGNWENGDIGGEGDSVTFAPTSKVYIRVPDGGVTVFKILGKKDAAEAVLMGGPIALRSSGTSRAEWAGGASRNVISYCKVVIPSDETVQPYLSFFDFRNQLVNESATTYPAVSTGVNYFHFDNFSEVHGERREAIPAVGRFGCGGGSIYFTGPVGAAAVSGTWRLVAGSPYATRVSGTVHALSVGTTVTSEGNLPSGTYLKRVFDNATIELSELAQNGGDATLAFAAFTPDFNAHFTNRWVQQGSYMYPLVGKSRAADSVRVEIDDLHIDTSTHTAYSLSGGYTYDQYDKQGVLVLHNVTSADTASKFNLKSIRLELDGTTFPTNFAFTFTMENSEKTSWMAVTNNKTAVIHTLTNFHGTIVKEGGGILRIGLGEAENEGSFRVDAGNLQVMRNATVAEGAALSVSNLTIKSGATFVVPDSGLTVTGAFSFENGATLAGAGELTIVNGSSAMLSSLATLARVGGATVRVMVTDASEVDAAAAAVNGDAIDVADGLTVSGGLLTSGTLVKDGEGTLDVDSLPPGGLEVRDGEVVLLTLNRDLSVPTNSWIHVDATDADTIEYESGSATKVHVWYDVNGKGCSLRQFRSSPASRTLNVVDTATGGNKLVDLGAQTAGSSGALIYYDAEGNISSNYNQRVSSTTYPEMSAPYLRTVVLVYDSVRGGGPIWGGVGADHAKKGLIRNAGQNVEAPICYEPSDSATFNNTYIPAISNGCENGTVLFMQNGVVTNPCSTYFKKDLERVVFRYPNGIKGDTFGVHGSSSAGNWFAGLKYGEIICFERALSNLEVARVDAYLAKKWFGVDTPGYGARSADVLNVASGAKVTILGEGALSTSAISGGGTVDGDLALSADGGITLEIGADGSLPCFNVTGAADLSHGGTVAISGRFRDLQPGTYTILTSSSLSFGGEWGVSAETNSRTFKLSAVGNSLVLTVFKNGVILLVK